MLTSVSYTDPVVGNHPGIVNMRWMIFTVKPDLRRKARLVIGGHVIDSEGHSTYASTVKLQSVRLLNLIAKANGLKCLSGDIGNAYLNAKTDELIMPAVDLNSGTGKGV